MEQADELLKKHEEIRRTLTRTGFTRGTREAFVFRLETDQNREQLRKTEEQIRAQQLGNEYLREIRDDIKTLKDSGDGQEASLPESDLF